MVLVSGTLLGCMLVSLYECNSVDPVLCDTASQFIGGGNCALIISSSESDSGEAGCDGALDFSSLFSVWSFSLLSWKAYRRNSFVSITMP